MLKLTIGHRLALGFVSIAGLLAVMYGVTLWGNGQIRRAQMHASSSLREAQLAQAQAEQYQAWRSRVESARADHDATIRAISQALLNNQSLDGLVPAPDQAPLAQLLQCDQCKAMRSAEPDTAPLLDKLTAESDQRALALDSLQEDWQVRHEGLAESLDDLQRTYVYWALKVANLIFVQSMMGEIVPEEPTDTALARFKESDTYKQFAPTMPALVDAIDKALIEDRKLWDCAGELDMAALMSEWDKARTMYRDVIPPATKAIAVHLGDVIRAEQVILAAQHRATDHFSEKVSTAADRAAASMKQIERMLADRVDQAQQRVADSRQSLSEATDHVTASIAMMDRLSMIIALVAVLLAVGAGWLLTRIIVKPIRAVSRRLQEIAHGDGDLTQRADDSRSDELGELARHFNQFVQNIHNIIAKLRGVAEEVVVAASQIASVSDQVSSSTSQQQHQVEQISAVIGQISQSIHDVAGQSEAVAGNAADAGQLAKDGGAVVGRTIDDMRSIGTAVQAAAQRVEQLSARSEQIGQIIELIDEIAEQTNLLALNAAIEAARAGAAGRGFAVVADEVRKLADRTTRATAQVAQAIQGIQSETGSAIEVMRQGTAQVDTGLGQADQAGQSLQQIVQAAQEVAGKVQTIASAAVEQSAATEQVSSSVESIARIAQNTHEGVDQAIDAVQRLNDRAHQVQELLSRFKLNETAGLAEQTQQASTEAVGG